MDVVPIPAFIDRDIATVRWVTNDASIGDVIIASVYVDQFVDPPVLPPGLMRLVNYCDRKSLKLLVLADFC